ncbi:MAG: proton-conducting transporter membrane subunit [Saprospiraceae bacterium]|nr:proton-conducting transporter membrane subunit [Saprospiraceae bacterium]
MEHILQLFIFIPLVGFILSLFFSNRQEKQIAAVAYSIVAIQFVGILLFVISWVLQRSPDLNLKHFVFYEEGSIEIFLDFYFDKVTAVFGLAGALITFLVLIFSKFYLHRDEGYKRFFNTVLLFFFGYNVAVFAGNFETLFIGWEFLGITSFLLIAFYRDRYLPVKNALKTISLYRLGDICLLLALWMSHHFWHENITFMKLNDVALVSDQIADHFDFALFISAMLIISATIKSAQFPFSSWLPRAMEGPTTSSAVFYGSLSVHLGVFLLLRTHTFWESIGMMKVAIILIGIVTTVIASLIARVQSTVKTQIAYASIAQIGLMFIEVALGWHNLVLIHFTGNALLRTYQLLVSPSVLGYLIHDQVFNFTPRNTDIKKSFLGRVTNTLYLWSIKEWNMDSFLRNVLWNPAKYVGNKFYFLSRNLIIWILGAVYIGGLLFFYFDDHIPRILDEVIHLVFAFISMMLVLAAFVEKKNAIKAWVLIILSQFYCVLSIALLNDEYQYVEILLYASGLLLAAIAGSYSLFKLWRAEKSVALNDFYGHIYEYPKLGFIFLLACFAFVSLPFTPSFIGIDLIFSHIDNNEYLLITITTINFLVLELAVLRIYARLFLGPHKKQTHPVAYRSS